MFPSARFAVWVGVWVSGKKFLHLAHHPVEGALLTRWRGIEQYEVEQSKDIIVSDCNAAVGVFL